MFHPVKTGQRQRAEEAGCAGRKRVVLPFFRISEKAGRAPPFCFVHFPQAAGQFYLFVFGRQAAETGKRPEEKTAESSGGTDRPLRKDALSSYP